MPQRSPMPLIVPCTWRRALADGGQRVGHGQVAVVVGVDAERDRDARGRPAATAAATSSGSAPPLVSHRTIQAAPAAAAAWMRPQGVVGVVLEAVEEMLGVVDHLAAVRRAEGDRVGDHPQVLVERDAEDLVDVQVPALADDRDDRRAGVDQGLHADVVLGGDVAAPGHAEGGDPGVLQLEVADRAEVGGVLGVGERITALDVVEAQLRRAAR